MRRHDRHGRAAAPELGTRTRPTPGFRARDLRRFTTLVRRAVGRTAPEVRERLRDAVLVIADVPDEAHLATEIRERRCAVLRTSGSGPTAQEQLVVFRRRAEQQARSAAELVALLVEDITDASGLGER